MADSNVAELENARNELAREVAAFEIEEPTKSNKPNPKQLKPSLSHKRMSKKERLWFFQQQNIQRGSFVRKAHSDDEADQLPSKLNDMTLWERSYYILGQYEAMYPWTFLAVGVLLIILLALGNINAKIEADITGQWIPVANRVRDEVNYVSDHVNVDTLITVEIMMQTSKTEEDNVFQNEVILENLKAAKILASTEAIVDGVTYTYQDVCDTSVRYKLQCVRSTVLDCFQEGSFDYPLTHTYSINMGALQQLYTNFLYVQCLADGPCASGASIKAKFSTYNACMSLPVIQLGLSVDSWVSAVYSGAAYDMTTISATLSAMPHPGTFGSCRHFLRSALYNEAAGRIDSIDKDQWDDETDFSNEYFWVARFMEAKYDAILNATLVDKYYDGTDAARESWLSTTLASMNETQMDSNVTEGLQLIFDLARYTYTRDDLFLESDYNGRMIADEDYMITWFSNNCPPWDGGTNGLGVSLPKPTVSRLGGLMTNGTTIDTDAWDRDLIVGSTAFMTGVQLSGPETLQYQWTSQFGTHKGHSVEEVREITNTWRTKWQDHYADVNEDNQYSEIRLLASNGVSTVVMEHTVVGFGQSLLGFLIAIVYLSLALSPFWTNQPQRLISRIGISIFAVIFFVFATIAGLGLGAGFGLPYNITTLQVIPFLTIGLGLTDFFMLAHAYQYYDIDRSVTAITGDTLVQMGPSITLTSFANFVAFLVGQSTPLPVVISFCQNCAIVVAVNFYVLLFMCPAALALDAQRMRDKKYDCLCCFKMKANFETVIIKENFIKRVVLKKFYFPFLKSIVGKVIILIVSFLLIGIAAWGFDEISLGFNMKNFVPTGTDEYDFLEKSAEHVSVSSFSMCSGELDYPSHQGTLLEAYERVLDTKFVVPPAFSWVTGFIEWGKPCGMEAWGTGETIAKAGTAPPFNWVYEKFPERYFPHNETNTYCAQQGYTANHTEYATKWYNKKCAWGYPTTNGLCGPRRGCYALPQNQLNTFPNGSTAFFPEDPYPEHALGLRYHPDDFYPCLQLWADSDLQVSPYKPNFYVLPNSYSVMRAYGKLVRPMEYSEVNFFASGLWTTQDYLDNIDEVRDALDSLPEDIDLFPYGQAFSLYEQYFFIEGTLWANVGYAVISMFCACVVTFGSLSKTTAEEDKSGRKNKWTFRIVWASMWTALILAVIILITVEEVYGFLGHADIEISAITAGAIVMTVNVTFLFTTHLTLSFLHSHGTREQRLTRALEIMFQPTVDGSIATTIGITILGASEFVFIYEYFFLVFLLILVFAAFNGLALLPVTLSLIGPPPLSETESPEEAQARYREKLKEMEAQDLLKAVRV
eukprot:TRINITY_DN14868_c0_g1::TRINITY_DN14868_c0_g1_i1::g.16234::m.16234 TRINITY_DN14868_c0_g1::TRINITY_DN14868_c0_g1_i1::g.16234  ORF type:complete len:1326 (-),score=485.95,sp/Q09614/PTC1_CAEEL/29.82/5e-33,sp/Q09614/PTC1_CAEEL/24.51/1e-31,Patched/PF02460.13/8.5,Patched/PF02460.13/9.9e-30,Patched/PF02460.13/1.8,Patched/PF02460.13/1.9e-08,Sterol-sensing/PF12349.3/8.8e-31,Sterol-sensing/PF12349.3/9.6e+03,DUF2207/PF09972.4/0.013,DUF2207/PF09972.4/69,DUF2207/PF09972.4/1.2e+04,CaKB/PF03185.10/4e+02,CaKB/PF